VLGFFVLLAVLGWHPDVPHKRSGAPQADPARALARALP
jgi:hypothetical protein